MQVPAGSLKQIAEKLKKLAENPVPRDSTPLRQEGGRRKFCLFNPVLDEEELAGCFHRLYIDCTRELKMPGQDGDDKMKFSAYLYYLVKLSGLKGENFNQSRFFDFVQRSVFKELEQKTLRTFNNRVNALKLLDVAVKSPKEFDSHPDFSYFQSLKTKFQKSNFFAYLKRLRNIFQHFM